MYTYVYTHIYIYIYTHILYIRTCVYMYIYIHMHIHTHIMYTRAYISHPVFLHRPPLSLSPYPLFDREWWITGKIPWYWTRSHCNNLDCGCHLYDCFWILRSSHLQHVCFWRWTLVVIYTLAFGFQKKRRFWNTKSFLREGLGVRLKLVLAVIIPLTERVLTVMVFRTELVLAVLIFLTEVLLTVLVFRTELVHTILVFLTELVLTAAVLFTDLVFSVLIFLTELVLTVRFCFSVLLLMILSIPTLLSSLPSSLSSFLPSFLPTYLPSFLRTDIAYYSWSYCTVLLRNVALLRASDYTTPDL
jgi:hypothetical protein